MTALAKGMTKAQFDQVVEETYEVVRGTGLATDKARLRADLRARLDRLNGKPSKPARQTLEDVLGKDALADLKRLIADEVKKVK